MSILLTCQSILIKNHEKKSSLWLSAIFDPKNVTEVKIILSTLLEYLIHILSTTFSSKSIPNPNFGSLASRNGTSVTCTL